MMRTKRPKMKVEDKLVAGDEIEVDGKVYVVALNVSKILTGGRDCEGCCAQWSSVGCLALAERSEYGNLFCGLDRHLIFKLKGDNDVQV